MSHSALMFLEKENGKCFFLFFFFFLSFSLIFRTDAECHGGLEIVSLSLAFVDILECFFCIALLGVLRAFFLVFVIVAGMGIIWLSL